MTPNGVDFFLFLSFFLFFVATLQLKPSDQQLNRQPWVLFPLRSDLNHAPDELHRSSQGSHLTSMHSQRKAEAMLNCNLILQLMVLHILAGLFKAQQQETAWLSPSECLLRQDAKQLLAVAA